MDLGDKFQVAEGNDCNQLSQDRQKTAVRKAKAALNAAVQLDKTITKFVDRSRECQKNLASRTNCFTPQQAKEVISLNERQAEMAESIKELNSQMSYQASKYKDLADSL